MSEILPYRLKLDSDGLISWGEFKAAIDLFLLANGFRDEAVRLGIDNGAHNRVRSSMIFSLHPLANGDAELKMTPQHEVLSYVSE